MRDCSDARSQVSQWPSASGGIARLVCARIRAAGLELAPFLAEAGLKVAQIDDPNVRLEASADQAPHNGRRGAARSSRVHLARDLELREAGLITTYWRLQATSPMLWATQSGSVG